MPKLVPFILLATFLTHDNNFHLYLSRECEKGALHHRARVPRGCRISRPGGLGPHLRTGRDQAVSPQQAGQAPPQAGNQDAPVAMRGRVSGQWGVEHGEGWRRWVPVCEGQKSDFSI